MENANSAVSKKAVWELINKVMNNFRALAESKLAALRSEMTQRVSLDLERDGEKHMLATKKEKKNPHVHKYARRILSTRGVGRILRKGGLSPMGSGKVRVRLHTQFRLGPQIYPSFHIHHFISIVSYPSFHIHRFHQFIRKWCCSVVLLHSVYDNTKDRISVS